MIGHGLGKLLGHLLGHDLDDRAPVIGGLRALNFSAGSVYSSASSASGTPGRPLAVPGDVYLLLVVSTSTPSPPSAGWTLVASQTDVNFTQQLNVWQAPYNVTAGNTVTQVTAGPLNAVILRLRGNHGGTLSIGTIASGSDTTTANPEPMVSVTPGVDATVLALGASSGQSASTSVTFTPSAGWKALFTSNIFRWRLALAFRAYKAGTPSAGSFASNGYNAGSSSSWNKLAIVLIET